MNLVVDDAVEVKQITKNNDKETRRPLGENTVAHNFGDDVLTSFRPNNAERGQRFAYPELAKLSRLYEVAARTRRGGNV